MEKKICPVCYGTMILLHDYWKFEVYWQCLDCGCLEKIE